MRNQCGGSAAVVSYRHVYLLKLAASAVIPYVLTFSPFSAFQDLSQLHSRPEESLGNFEPMTCDLMAPSTSATWALGWGHRQARWLKPGLTSRRVPSQSVWQHQLPAEVDGASWSSQHQ